MLVEHLTPAIEDRAVEVREILAQLTALHSEDFELIATTTGQQTPRLE
jgi:hypothetical protein